MMDVQEEAKEIIRGELTNLKNQKLWHQLTLKVLDYVQDANDAKYEEKDHKENLLQLYKEFILPIENNMNPYIYVEILSFVIRKQNEEDVKEALALLKAAENKVKADPRALIFCKILQGEIHLNHLNDKEIALAILKEAEALVLDLEDNSIVHNKYYSFARNYYHVKNQYTEYYSNCLKYLGSMDLKMLPRTEQMELARLLTIAVLLSEEIFNLGELLQHPITTSLKNTPEEWLFDLLAAFNSGDIKMFEKMTPKWSGIPDLLRQKKHLRTKISLLCLMDMAFKRPTKDRRLPFKQISQDAGIPIDEVELLVMKLLSKGLAKGFIDQVSQEVHLNWVQPRVLDKGQIKGLISRLDAWVEDVNSMKHLIEETGLQQSVNM